MSLCLHPPPPYTSPSNLFYDVSAFQMSFFRFDFNGVAKGVLHCLLLAREDIVRVDELDILDVALALAPQLAILADPRLRAQRASKLTVVTDHNDTPLAGPDSRRERDESITVPLVKYTH